MNLKTVLFAVLITVALVSAAPIQVEETEVVQTFPDSESNGEAYDETFDESGHPIQSAKRDASELTTESQTQEENIPTTTDDNSSEGNASEGRKAFNSDMLNVVIGAVDGAVDVALGAVTGAVDVALGTVTGAASVAAGTVTGAVGVISGTVDGTLGVISGIAKPTKQVASTMTVYQPAHPRPAYPQLAYPGHPIVSRPIVAQAQSNIVGTPPGLIMSDAVLRESTNMDNAETKPIISEEEIAITGAEIKPEVSPVIIEEMTPAQTKPIISEEEIAATGAEIRPMITKTIADAVETTDTEAVPEVSPVVAEEIAQTKPIISEEEIAATGAEIKPIMAKTIVDTEMPMNDMFTVGTSMSVDNTYAAPSTKPVVITVIGPNEVESAPEVSPVIVEEVEEMGQTKPIIGEEEIATTGAQLKPITGFTPMVAPVISEPIIMNIEDNFTPIITGQMMADEPTVEMTNTEEMAAPTNMAPVDVAETSDDVTDDVVRDKRMPHDHGHEHGDCNDRSSHEKDE